MLDLILLAFLVICALAAVQLRDLLSAIMLLTVYSLIMAVVWTRLNSVDVAFTEASVGAGITTILLIAALSRMKRQEGVSPRRSRLASVPQLSAVFLVMGALLYGTVDMPSFGDPNAPTNVHVIPRYLEHGVHETGVENFVTAILAAYRGYDTLGETTVIFTAGMCVILLLRQIRKGG
jgi:multicomponent Na+:H+ antiporter subunit B